MTDGRLIGTEPVRVELLRAIGAERGRATFPAGTIGMATRLYPQSGSAIFVVGVGRAVVPLIHLRVIEDDTEPPGKP